MKKILAIILTLALVLGMASVPAFADESASGSITITNYHENVTYEIYRMLDLESYDKDSGAYSYRANSEWEEFFTTNEAKAYITFDDAGYATWVIKDDDASASVAAFGKLALAYAKINGINPVKSSKNPADMVVITEGAKFSNLPLGYYLVDTSMGALCGLTTTNPNAVVNAKNGIPTIDKQVKEDSTSQWGDKNTADIGQTVEFRVTVNVHAGAQNYVLHDIMDAGFTYQDVTKVEKIIPGATGTPSTTKTVSPENYTVKTGSLEDGCTFEVHFKENFCDSLESNDKLVIYYNAMLNRNALVASTGNKNEAWLDFGEGNHSTHDTITTYTYGIDIVKTDSQNNLIDGAEFKIYDAVTGGNEVPVVLMDDGVTYRRARADERGVSIEVKDGKVRVVGFDNGTYYLEETKAPAGYNQLSARQSFTISDANLEASFVGDIYSTGSGVHVVNKTGSMLPETGGFGTTMFILIGGFAVLAAGVLLFVNKRMSKIAE